MLLPLYGKIPDISRAAFAAPDAVFAGDVTLDEGASVWFGAVLRADTGAIRIGRRTNIQDGAILHTGPDLSVTLGDDVTIGHGAVVHGCTVADGALIGMHATLLNGCVIGTGAVVAAGALVSEGTVVAPGMLAVGVPARVLRPVTPELRAYAAHNAAHYAALAQDYAAALRAAQAPHGGVRPL